MKIIFTTQKAVNGIRIYTVEVDAKVKSERAIRSHYTNIYYGRPDAHDPIMNLPPVKMIDGVEYLDT